MNLEVERFPGTGKIDVNFTKFMVKYNRLTSYLESNNTEYPNEKSDKKLFQWVKNLRQCYKRGELEDRRVDLLNKINFDWRGKTQIRFEDRIKHLLEYKRQNGSIHVSQSCRGIDDVEYGLSRWVNEMRRKYNENRLSIEYINRLNKIGFIWNIEDARFEKRVTALKRFYKIQGHFDVPQTGRTQKLGNWVAGIRSRGVVTEKYRLWLDQIGFSWEGVRKRKDRSIQIMIEVDLRNAIQRAKIKSKSK
jgi:uncharacterized protein YutD